MAAYLVAEILVTDPEIFETYRQPAGAVFARYGGRYLVRGGEVATLQGEDPGRVIVLQFDSLATARTCLASEEYQALVPLRVKSSTGRVYLVEGL